MVDKNVLKILAENEKIVFDILNHSDILFRGCIGVTYVNGFLQRFLVGDTCTTCMKAYETFRGA